MKKFLFLLIKKYRVTVLLLLILALSCGILATFITSTESEIINMVIRRFSEGRFQAGFVSSLILLAALYLLSALLPSCMQFLESLLAPKIDKTAKELLFAGIHSQSYENLETPSFRDLWNRVTGKLDDRLNELLPAILGPVHERHHEQQGFRCRTEAVRLYFFYE